VNIHRGDIFLVNFEPAKYSEANKIRPAIVLSNDKVNLYAANIVVIPLTSKIDRIYPFQLFLPAERTGLKQDSKAQVEMIKSLSKKRLKRRLGNIGPADILELEYRIKFHLGFEQSY